MCLFECVCVCVCWVGESPPNWGVSLGKSHGDNIKSKRVCGYTRRGRGSTKKKKQEAALVFVVKRYVLRVCGFTARLLRLHGP